MILPENPSKKPLLKPNSHDQPLGQESDENAAPPPYRTFTPIHQPTPQQATRAPSAGRRFFRTLAVAFIIWFLATAFVHSLVQVARSTTHPPYPFPHNPHEPDVSLPPNMSFDHCQEWSDTDGHRHRNAPPYTSAVSFDLPASSAALFVISSSHRIGGGITVGPSPDLQTTDVRINVEVHYYREEIRDRAHVCLLKREEDEHGVGIFTDEPWPPIHRKEDQLSFSITVLIPRTTLHSFETDLPNFSHIVGDFPPEVYFENLSLKSTNGAISASVGVNKGFIKTTNGPIKGEFTADHALVLQTTNGLIDVGVHLNNEAQQQNHATLDMKTTNGMIRAATWLALTDKDAKKGGNYNVTAQTTNSPVEVNVVSAPIDSGLWLFAKSTNSLVSATAHPTFQGTFELGSTLFRPTVQVVNTNNDPTGQGRTRRLDLRMISNRARGSTYWDNGRGTPELKGAIEMQSTNSPVKLVVL